MLALGLCIGLVSQHQNFASGISTFWYLKKRKKIVLLPLPNLKFALPPMRNPNVSQWNIGCDESPMQDFHVGHVHFIIFMCRFHSRFSVEYELYCYVKNRQSVCPEKNRSNSPTPGPYHYKLELTNSTLILKPKPKQRHPFPRVKSSKSKGKCWHFLCVCVTSHKKPFAPAFGGIVYYVSYREKAQ